MAATMLAGFIGSMFSGKPVPKLESFLPLTPQEQQANEERQLKLLEAQMRCFAIGRNKLLEANNGK